MNSNNYAVIMAGGIGSRFWPMSRTKLPKQFIDILGTGSTLIQQTFKRLSRICPKENILIVTNEHYKNLVLDQLEVKQNQVLCEPMMRNTAPCVAYAAFKIHKLNPNASMIVAPSDHLILDEDEFIRCVKHSFIATNQNDILITLGMQPNRPDTGYGYIQHKEDTLLTDSSFKKVKTFTEKPNLELAQEFIKSGDFLWNSGIFIWSAKSILNRFHNDLKDIYDTFTQGAHYLNTDQEGNFINTSYANMKNISIDVGIMEKADNVYVMPANFGWSDLGTFGSLYTLIQKDNNDNALVSKNVMTYNSSNNMVHSSTNKLVVLDGLDNYIIVDQKDVLLICKKENEQLIKQYMHDAKSQKGEEYI